MSDTSPLPPLPLPSSPSSSSSAILCDQCSAPDLNGESARSVCRAGPQLRVCEISVPRRTSTASLRGQCSAPDLNRESARSVLRAGPQPRVCEISVACRTSTASLRDQCCVPDLNRGRQDEGLDPSSYFHAGELMGHIPILLIAGDFLQIKPANEISLADSLEELVRKRPDKVQTEHYAAQAALMSIETVIHLKKSKRFLDVQLPQITAAMRTCTPAAPLSEDHLHQLRARKIENCSKELQTDFFKHGHVVGMYWENIARSMVERARRDAQELDVPLFCLQAADQRHARKNKTIDKQLTHQLLTVPNPHRTGKLQGMLLVHENMIVRLSDVLAPHLGLVKDKLAMVVKVDLHHEDQERLRHREPGFCHFVPEYMAKGIWVKLLKGKSSPMEDALLKTWEEQFENVFDHADDAKKLFFVELMHAEFKIDLKIGDDNEKIEVIRWQFPLLHGMLRTAYSAQGLTLDGGVLVDLRRAGGLEDDDWWLAIYVMLTRARKLENLILLGFTEQVEDLLRRGPPTYLRALTDKLEAKAATTLERLQSWPDYDALQAG